LGAVLGVVIPGLVFILIVGLHSSAARGWVIPTATDVAFALVIFTLFGKHLSRRARSFLLTFAVIDDLIAMILIALLFTQSINLFSLTLSLAGMIVFAYLIRRPNVLAKYAASVAAMFVWYEIGNSGIHPTLAGLLIGFLVPKHLSNAVESALRPWVSFAALPLFALFATAIELPEFNSIPIALFVAIAIRPLTKWIGISTGALIGNQLTSKNNRMRNSEILRVASLGGIGFTVSLLVAQLSLTDQNQKAAAGLATLMSAFISMAVGAVVLIAGHRTKSAHSS
jgi:NhaA family Na+:H+ antiporter